jgi:nitrogen-specific signal transduction histidine kinase/ActR/RegA family two-component response regulator
LDSESKAFRELKEENQRLESQLTQARKMESIGILAGGIAHDFNNILAAIMGHVEIAQLNTPSDHPLHHNLSQILQAVYRAKDLVQQILTFCRLTDSQMQPVQLDQILKEVLRLLRASLPSTIDIHSHIDDGTGVILADPTRIHQILMNLCANSSHSMGEKGGRLDITLATLELDEREVEHINGLTPGKYLKLSVSDTGHGIHPNIQDRIFEPYFTTKESGKGTGMGLTMVNDIIRNHHGSIQVFSKVNEGTTFHLYFPRIEAEIIPEVQVPEQAPKGTERILFVDDEKDLADMVKRILEHLGYQAFAQTNSVEALETFRSIPDNFDLVITDMTMPNMTGDIFSEEIKKIRSDIPIILCSGFSPFINKEKAKNLGIKNFLMKPLAINDLAKAIRNALDTTG